MEPRVQPGDSGILSEGRDMMSQSGESGKAKKRSRFWKPVLRQLWGAFNVVAALYFAVGTFHEYGGLGVLLLFGITGSVVGYIAFNTDFFKGDDWINVLLIANCIAMVVLVIGSQL